VVGALIGAVIILGVAIWSIKRHKDPHLEHLESDKPLEDLIPSLSGMALGMPIPGNSVQIFQNGAFFDALIADIAAARHSVHFETFLWKDGHLSRRLADALCAKARERVIVRMVLDAQGTRRMGEEMRDRLRAAGCQLALYHPRTLKNIGVIPERDHRKIAVLDGRTAQSSTPCNRCSARTGSRSPARSSSATTPTRRSSPAAIPRPTLHP